MKFKKLSLVLASLMFGAVSFAQANEMPQSPFRLDGLYTYVGVQGGVNFASLSGGDAYSLNSTTGFQAGAQVEFQYSPWFSIMPELRYQQRGFGVSYFNASQKLDYIELPILAKFSMPNRTDWTPFVFIGPNFSFRVGSGGNGNLNYVGSANTFDFGIDSGVGVQYQLNQTTRVFVDFEYYAGLTDVYSNSNLSNSVPEFNLGFSWAL
jgi:hypothetical protein